MRAFFPTREQMSSVCGIGSTALPIVVSAVSSIVLWMKINSVEAKQDEILDEIQDIKDSVSAENLASAILEATSLAKEQKKKEKEAKKLLKKEKKDKKDKKDNKDKKGKKDKKKKDKKKKRQEEEEVKLILFLR